MDTSISRKEAKQKVIQYSEEHRVNKSVIMTVAGATNVKLDYNVLAEKGDADMCTLFEEIAKESEVKGKIEGRIEGEAKGIIEAGFDFGLSEKDILERLQKKLDISMQSAYGYLNMFGKIVQS